MFHFFSAIRSQSNPKKNLVRNLFIRGIISIGVLFFSTATFADLEQIKARGVINIVTEDDYAPFEMFENGKPTGFNHDIIAEFRKYAPFKVNSATIPFTGLLASILAGQYDMGITGTLVAGERLDVINFAPPFASARHYAIIRVKDDTIKTVADLCGKKVGVQAGSIFFTRLSELREMLKPHKCNVGEVVQYTSYPEAYADLANGRLDFVVNSFVPAKVLATSRPKVFKLSVPVTGEGFHAWPIPKQSPELLAYITDFMQHLRDTGKFAELQRKWFGEEIPGLPTEPLTNKAQYYELIAPKN